MGLMTCHITTLDPDELHDALHLLQSFATGDRRPLTLEYRLTGLDIHVGDPQPDETPTLLGELDDWVTLDEPTVIRIAHDIVDDQADTEPESSAADAVRNIVKGTSFSVADLEAPAADDTPVAKAAPEPDPDGTETCPGCDQPYRTRRAVSDHIRSAHWDDVIATYADLGAQGLQTDWGVSQGTAYRWAADIRGDNAA